MDNRPIGVFDSGLGGLTAVRAIHKILPHQDIIYLGDTARVPYGTRGPDVITRYALSCARYLLRYEIKALVVACGTVSTVALEALKNSLDIPVLGVVEPTCAAAANATINKRVGVIATPATIANGAYKRKLAEIDKDIRVYAEACPLLVPLVENGRFKRGDTVAETVVAEYLTPMREHGIDTLMLGCTHYPLLMDIIGDFMGGTTLIDAGESVAKELESFLGSHDSCGEGAAHYLVTDSAASFSRFAEMILQNSTKGLVEGVDIDEN